MRSIHVKIRIVIEIPRDNLSPSSSLLLVNYHVFPQLVVTVFSLARFCCPTAQSFWRHRCIHRISVTRIPLHGRHCLSIRTVHTCTSQSHVEKIQLFVRSKFWSKFECDSHNPYLETSKCCMLSIFYHGFFGSALFLSHSTSCYSIPCSLLVIPC
jgi:hypothetical protein